MPDTSFSLVSVHGGHSGQFCNHAGDTLEAVVQEYVNQGFMWIGLTEHMPPERDDMLYPEERQAGLTVPLMQERFDQYIEEARRLQTLYRSSTEILVGFETEYYNGCPQAIKRLVSRYRPDYFVGSLHHVAGVPFDYNPKTYQRAVASAGGVHQLYRLYFDAQYDMLKTLRPPVVGHFDLIRIYDDDYRQTFRDPRIWRRVERNLTYIAQVGLILDFNVAALRKGADEPYITSSILTRAREMGIAVTPGDDSHGVATVGKGMPEGIAILKRMGFSMDWAKPKAV